MAKVVRVLIYEGDPDWIMATMNRSSVPLNGREQMSARGEIRSIITEAIDTKCLVCGENKTNNNAMICMDCSDAAMMEVIAAIGNKKEGE